MKHEICTKNDNTMRETPKGDSRYKIVRLLGILIIIVVVSFVTWQQVNLRTVVTPDPTVDPFATYDPATYGIPDTIAGYKVLTVQTMENTACMSPETMRLTIQPVEPLPGNPLASQSNGDVRAELKKLKPDVHWELQYITAGPYDREKFIVGNATWNETMQSIGCLRTGPPGPTITATE